MSVVSQVTGVFSDILEWFITAMTSMGALFYETDKGLTFLGTLSVIGVGIAVILLIANMIKSFLHLG